MIDDALFGRKKERIRERFLKYTRKAFRMLPRLDKPRILDIGCGSGIPTLELAKLTQGEVLGIDIDRTALKIFNGKIREAGLAGRVRTIYCSIFDMKFPDESFDIIWTEGAIYPVGFKKGLREWRRFLKPGGFLAVHDEQGNIGEKLGQIPDCGYELLGHFLLSKETWWKEYFAPLEKLVADYQKEFTDNLKIPEEIQQARSELDMFRKEPERNSSAFFVMKKK